MIQPLVSTPAVIAVASTVVLVAVGIFAIAIVRAISGIVDELKHVSTAMAAIVCSKSNGGRTTCDFRERGDGTSFVCNVKFDKYDESESCDRIKAIKEGKRSCRKSR